MSAAIGLLAAMTIAAPPPATPVRDARDRYHGVEVVDPYRWLEEGASAEVLAWTRAQDKYARRVLSGMSARRRVARELRGLLGSGEVRYRFVQWRSGRLFAIKWAPPREQPILVVMPDAGAAARARVLVDPGRLDKKGSVSIDFYEVSPDGGRVAVSLSKAGTESGDVSVYDTRTGARVGEVVPRVNGGTAGGSLAWDKDGQGFFYTRYPRGDERPAKDRDFFQQVYYHRLGQPTAQDRYELGKGFPRIAQFGLQLHAGTGRLLATVQYGDSGRFALHLRDADGTWTRLTDFGGRVVQGTFAPDGSLFLIARKGSPAGRILRLAPGARRLDEAVEILKAGAEPIVSDFYGPPPLVATRDRLVLTVQKGGPSEVRLFDHAGKPQPGPQQPPVSSVRGLAAAGGAILLETESFISPPAWLRFDPARAVTSGTSLITPSPADFSDVEVVREHAVSKDGTRVPVNIIRRKGPRKPGACVATGYGGYGISLVPRFRPHLRVLLDRGVCYAVANLRGGGELGEAWHHAGRLTKKQNVFDDFAGVLRHLVERGYTTPERLGIMGGSNGGLLMGATVTQHPKLVAAVVGLVGIYDSLRFELSPNGAFNTPELGTVKDPDQFRAMYAYSPYHRVRDGEAYPAVLLMTGNNDPRVDPMHSRKMAARLQAATSSKAPVLLRTFFGAGHGGGSSLGQQRIQLTEIYAFFLHHLGVTGKTR